MAILTIKSEAGEEVIPLTADVHIVGRGLESDIRLKDIKASRQHCRLLKKGTTFTLIDLESGNGTRVNGNPVSEHILVPLDQIQIGSTTLVYGNEAALMKDLPKKTPMTDAERQRAGRSTARAVPKPPTARKSPTGQRPAVPGRPKPPTARKSPSGQRPSVPGRPKPPTARKSPSGQRPSVTTKPGTSRTRTASGRKTTSRIPLAKPGSKHATGRKTSLTDRFQNEISRKKTNPMVFLVGIPVVAVVLIIAGIVILPQLGGDDLPFVKDQVQKKSIKGNEYYSADRFEDAIREWEAGIEICTGDYAKELKKDKKSLERSIEGARRDIADRSSAREDWEALKVEYEGNQYKTYNLLTRAKAMKVRHDPINPPWILPGPGKTVGELPEMIERLANQWKTEERIREGLKFQETRNAIDSRHLKKEPRNFSAALKEWKEYLANPDVQQRDKNLAAKQVDLVNRLANGAWRLLGNRADRFNSAGDAVRLLRKNLSRFEGCVFNDIDLGKAIRDKIATLGG